MYFIEKTNEFDKWFRKLKDIRAKAKILFRIQKLQNEEHFGDCKPVGNGISELRINFAKGYRIYFKETDGKIIILLIGGDKSSQQKDIEKAKEIWDRYEKEGFEAQQQVRNEPVPTAESIWDNVFANNENADWRKF